jgi:hypothetical protein
MSSWQVSRRALLRGWCAASVTAWGVGCATRRSDTTPPAAATSIPAFSSSPPNGGLPQGWTPYAIRRDLRSTDYRTVSDGSRTVVQACSSGSASGLRCPLDMRAEHTGILRFAWKIDRLDPRSTVTSPRIDDSPARVILAFDGDIRRLSLKDLLFYEQVEFFTGQRLPYATLMYVWDGQAPVEEIVAYSRSSRIRYLVVESGDSRAGQWCHYERDVVADFQRAFGEAPGRISSAGVLTDSDDLQIEALAWYGDVSLDSR